LKNIGKSVGVTEDKHFHIVPGNHDMKFITEENLEKIYTLYEHNEGIFSGMISPGMSCHSFLSQRFDFFDKCAKELNNDLWNGMETGPIHRVQHFDYENYSIVYLNTAIASGRGEKDRTELLIGHKDIFDVMNKIKNRGITTVFILSHHSQDCMSKQELQKIRNIFRDNNTLSIVWLYGDSHDVGYNDANDICFITPGGFLSQENTVAGFLIGELRENELHIRAHSYNSDHSTWEYNEAVSYRINSILPKKLKESQNSSTQIKDEDALYTKTKQDILRKYANYVEETYNNYNKMKFIDQEFKHVELYIELKIISKNKDKELFKEQGHEIKEKQDEIYSPSHLLRVKEPCVLIGESGSGKTTIIRDLLLKTLLEKEYIPIFIELPKLAEKCIPSNCKSQWSISYSMVEGYILDKLGLKNKEVDILCNENNGVKTTKLLIFFDSMDEIPDVNQFEVITETLEKFLTIYKGTKLIFTSRPSCEKIKNDHTFNVGGEEIQKFYVRKLSTEDRKLQIEKIIEAKKSELKADVFLDELVQLEKRNPRMEDMIKNPLLLSLILSVYEENVEEDNKKESFLKSKIEIYKKAVSIIIKRSQVDLVEHLLYPHIETLLGRIALSLSEEAIKKTSKMHDILLSDLTTEIILLLNINENEAKSITNTFFEFINNHAIFVNNKFLHESFKEYFAAKYLFQTLKRNDNEEKTTFEKIYYLYSNQSSLSVIEMLLLITDIETKQCDLLITKMINIILEKYLDKKPHYLMLIHAVSQFVYHYELILTKLTISMFERACEKDINPFDELFWFVSEYCVNNIAEEKDGFVWFNKAYDYVSRKYAHDLKKLYLASMCFELFLYFYCEKEDSLNKYELYLSLLGAEFLKLYNEWTKAKYSSFMEIGNEKNIPNSMGNLIFINKNGENVNFNEFANARRIKIHPQNANYVSEGNALYSKNKTELFHHLRKGMYSKEFKIPETVEHIADYTFSNCINIETIIISPSVKTIGNFAFYKCRELKKIDIPDSVKSIGIGAFEGCTNLEEVKLPKTLLEIRKRTFLNCSKLTHIHISESIIVIGEYAFGNCEKLNKVELPKSLQIIQKQKAFSGCKKIKFVIRENPYFCTDGTTIYDSDKTTIVAFPSAKGEIKIPNSVKTIDEYAFSGCSELIKVRIENSNTIYDNAFSNSSIMLKNIINNSEIINTAKLSSFFFDEDFEINLLSDKKDIIEIKTGCFYKKNGQSFEISLFLQKYKDSFYFHDSYKTYEYLYEVFYFTPDVNKFIYEIIKYFDIQLNQGNNKDFFLSVKIDGNKYHEAFLRLFYCIETLNHMKIFFVY
jgi:predicted phosphodiesterase